VTASVNNQLKKTQIMINIITEKQNHLHQIRETVETYFGFSIVSPAGKRATQQVNDAKMIYSSIARKLTHYSQDQVGQVINRDHATVRHHCIIAENLLQTDKKFRTDWTHCFDSVPIQTKTDKICDQYEYHMKKARQLEQEMKEEELVY
jgi:chromosomal replication initiation ATPase DnaA